MGEQSQLAFRFEWWLRRLFRAIGLDLQRYRSERTQSGQLLRMLAAHDVNLVFDVGANTGQFALGLREAGYSGRIVSFEPLSSAHKELVEASRGDEAWEVASRMALGEHPGEIELLVAGNSVSSSVLKMLEAHRKSVPASRYISSETTPLSTMDREAPEYLRPGSRCFIKIDTQGYESAVLAGARDTLAMAAGVQVELSLVPLYEGQANAETLMAQLCEMGFAPWAQWPAMFDTETGRLLQVDAVLFASDHSRHV